MIRIAWLVPAAILVCISCRKEKSSTDFRDAYTGTYKVLLSVNCYGCSTCAYQKDTTLQVKKGSSDSSILVLGREIILDAEGRYTESRFGVHLWNDSLYISYLNGTLGCGQREVYQGLKD